MASLASQCFFEGASTSGRIEVTGQATGGAVEVVLPGVPIADANWDRTGNAVYFSRNGRVLGLRGGPCVEVPLGNRTCRRVDVVLAYRGHGESVVLLGTFRSRQ